MAKRKSVVIIGAGYTGLVSALRLAQKGHKVTILERGSTVGGLASGFKVEGASLERAYHHLFRTDTSIINLTKELGIGDKLKWHDSSVAVYYHGKLYPFMTPIDLLKFKPLHFINRLRTGMVVYYLQKTNNWEKFKHISAFKWMRRAAGKQVCDVLWEPLLKGKFDKYYDQVAMAWLWARIHVRANSKEKGDTKERLGYFEGGFQTFVDSLVQKLDELDVKILTGIEITSINSLPSDKVKIELASGKNYIYDACIATVPSKVFGQLVANNHAIKPAYLKQLNSIDYLGARLLVFSSTQDISPYYWHNINDLSLPFLVFINHTKLIDKSVYNNYNVYYIGTYLPHDHELFTCDDSDIETLWFNGLKTIFHDFDSSKIREKHHFRFANAQHIVDTHYDTKIPPYETPLANIYLANFSQIYPEDRGTNYAVREGEKIAQLIP